MPDVDPTTVMAGTAVPPDSDSRIDLADVLGADAAAAITDTAPVEPQDDDIVEDEVRLLPGGRVSLRIAGRRILLAPPTNRVLHDFRVLLQEALTIAKDEAVAAEEAKGAGDQLSRVDALLAELAPTGDKVDAAMYAVLEFAVGRLSTTPMPPRAECSPWVTSVSLYVSLIKHWRQVPLVPGR